MASETMRVTILTDLGFPRRVHKSILHEFATVIASVSDTHLVERPDPNGFMQRSLVRLARSRAAHRAHLPSYDHRGRIEIPECDLFVVLCSEFNGLSELLATRGWRERSNKAVAFVLESWKADFEIFRPEVNALSNFDHVFFFNPHSAAQMAALPGSPPSSFLAAATDMDTFAPSAPDAPRSIDVYSMGRRSDALHALIRVAARERKLNYIFDHAYLRESLDYSDTRLVTSSMHRNSRASLCFDITVGAKAQQAQGEHIIPARYFEAAAAGSVIIGSKPSLGDFDEMFDWKDAVIELPALEALGFMLDVLKDEARLTAARVANVANSLRRHDWSFRFETMLQAVGLAIPAALVERKARLAEIAERLWF